MIYRKGVSNINPETSDRMEPSWNHQTYLALRDIKILTTSLGLTFSNN